MKNVKPDTDRLYKCFGLFVTFFKASAFTFAGGLAMLPVIEKDVVEKYRLASKEDFMEYAVLAQTMPGVIALNCATLIGRQAAGFWGMLAAGLGAIIPAFILMVVATILINLVPQQGPLQGAMRGVRAASAALVLSAAFSLGRFNLKDTFAVVVMLAALLLVVLGSISTPLIIVLAGVAGCIYQRIKRYQDRRHSDAS